MKPVKYYVLHYNRPDFIRLQVDSFRKFCKDEQWEMIIINTGHTAQERKVIKEVCDIFQLPVVDVVPTMAAHTAHGEILGRVFHDYVKKDKGYHSIIIDGDMFPICDFTAAQFLEPDVTFAGRKEQRDHLWHYINPGLLMVNVDNITNIDEFRFSTPEQRGGTGDNGTTLDCGGQMYKYFQQYPEDKRRVNGMNHSWVITTANKNLHVLPPEILAEYDEQYCLEILGDTFFHYCRSSNWNQATHEHHQKKTALVQKAVYGAIAGKIVFPKTGFMAQEDTHWGWGNWLAGNGSWK